MLVGGRGNDYLDGGAGIDTVSYSGATEAVRMYHRRVPMEGEGVDTFFGVESLVGSGFDDMLSGNYLGESTARGSTAATAATTSTVTAAMTR